MGVTFSAEELLAEARPRLWRAYVGVRGVDGADDAAAEALAWGWEHQERLQAMQNPIGYLYRVGLTRSTPRRSPMELPTAEDVGIPDIEPELMPALLQLTENQRAAVWLVHACGWSYADVGQALKMGRSTVGTHVARALEALRLQLEVRPHA